MREFSWYTIPVKVGQCTVYKYAVDRYKCYRIDRSGFGSYIHVKAGAFVTADDGGWERSKPNLKGDHHHRRNYCICSQCGHWFRRNRGIHDYEFPDGPLHFCDRVCDEQAQWEASLEADVGGGYLAHYWDAAENEEWKRKREKRR